MRKSRRAALWLALMLLVSGLLGLPARDVERHAGPRILEYGDHRLRFDPPETHLRSIQARSSVDTVWFGGLNPATGSAIRGGIWDFEDGTAQGWSSTDLTDEGLWFRRRTHADFDNDPVIAVINGNASMWCGRHQDEAWADCWPGGQGYGNNWAMHARKTFTYDGSDSVTIGFEYFVDSEVGFDFTYVYVHPNGETAAHPINTSENPNSSGWGYSGNVEGFPPDSNIGSPGSPATESLLVDEEFLPEPGQSFEVDLQFDSDPLFSDGIDSFHDFLNSHYGPFGFDDFTLSQDSGTDLSNFESGMDGWTTDTDPAIGKFLSVRALSELDPIPDLCPCPLSESENDYVMLAANLSGQGFYHPEFQFEEMISNAAPIGPEDGFRYDRFVCWSAYGDLDPHVGVSYLVNAHYYPWSCPETGVVGWTLRPVGPGGYQFTSEPECKTLLANFGGYLPLDVDSLRVVFRLISDCDDFGGGCTGPEDSNQSPLWDDIQIGLVGLDVNAPILDLDLAYQDVFPGNGRTNGVPDEPSLAPFATADPHSYHDNNRNDGDPSNATMGDSVVVMTGVAPDLHVYLNYRVTPGPVMDTSGFWYQSEYLPSIVSDGFAEVEMDTVEISDTSVPGRYASYVHENDPNYQAPEHNAQGKPSEANKIIENDVLTPGSTVEYFFTGQFGTGPKSCVPDTAGGFFLEFDVLPGYVSVGGEIVSPCLLYVDAYNAGAQVPIERWGLGPYLGQITHDTGVRRNWDRYDYLAAGTNACAPMAREVDGDNGMSKYQSMAYHSVLYNTGTLQNEGLRDGDARLLTNFVLNDDFNRFDIMKGLWLSGDGMPTILGRSGRLDSNQFLAGIVRAAVLNDDSYRDQTGDESFCLKLDPAIPRHFPTSGPGTSSYASIRGNGCPGDLDLKIIQPLVSGLGNLVYEDQDGGGTITPFASTSNDQFVAPPNYGAVLDAFSLHHLRATASDFSGDGTDACTDTVAVTRRLADVFDWFQVSLSPCPVATVDTPEDPPGATAARTTLYRSSPNPFNPRTTVRYDLAGEAHVRLEVFDVEGRRVRTLVDGVQKPQRHEITWDGSTDAAGNVASGVYWVRMSTSEGFVGSTKLVLLK